MKGLLNDILHIIQIDFFIAYGLYTLVYIVLMIITSKNENLKRIDQYCNSFISFWGISYFLIYILVIFFIFTEPDSESKNKFITRFFGPHWFAYWLQPLLWLATTQLLRIKQLNRLLLVRLVFALLFMFSFEKFVIIMTTLERDYVPSGWPLSNIEIEYSIMEIITACCFKITFFVLLSFLFQWLKEKLIHVAKLRRSSPSNS